MDQDTSGEAAKRAFVAPTYVFGLFEGGGAKGIAYAGVISECDAKGIRFEGACGVSAGAIAAALVSAGLPSDRVAELLRIPLKAIIGHNRPRLLRRVSHAIWRWVTLRGIRSPDGIERWLDDVLRAHLNLERSVQFQDLPRPLAVLAYDIDGRSPYVWSSARTPTESVASAVCASCSIPVYFEPYKVDQRSYLDGGIIENVPTFLISELTEHTSLPTLAFRLSTSYTQIVPKPLFRGPLARTLEFVGNVIDARSSATRIPGIDVRDIPIDCGNVSSTNFRLKPDHIAELISAGRRAVAEALPTALANRAQRGNSVSGAHTASKLRHKNLLSTGELLTQARESVEFFAGDVSWFEELAPYLVKARQRGVRLSLITASAKCEDLEVARRLGVDVGISPVPQPIRGLIVDAGLIPTTMLIVEKSSQLTPLRISSADAPRVLDHFSTSFAELWRRCSVLPAYDPILRRLDLTEIEKGLRRVQQYQGCRISVEQVSPDDVRPSSRYVETFKLARVSEVESLYSHIDSEKGYHIDGTRLFSIWPVLERRSEGLVVIDGTHRFYSAHVSGKMVWSLVINGCAADLPSDPVESWNVVRITTAKLDRTRRFQLYRPERFREIKNTLAEWFAANNR